MTVFVNCLAVGVAGFAGAVSRYLVGMLFDRLVGRAFPVGTLVINVSGSFLLGWFLATVGHRMPVPETVRLAVAVGFLGAYTTFSTFAYESDALLAAGAYARALLNLLGSLVAGLVAVRLGALLGGR